MISGREVVAALCLAGLVVCFSSAENEIPFPDAVTPNPLKYPYAASESLYLQPSEPIAPVAAESLQTGHATTDSSPVAIVLRPRIFQLPASGRDAIRVLIIEHSEQGALSAHTGILVLWRKSDGGVGREDFDGGDLRITRSGAGFQVSGSDHRDVSVDASSLRLSPENPVVPLQLNGKPYRGSFDFYSDGNGFQCVNVLPMEDYLRGVVPLEMGQPKEKGLEALKAQAVVARTYGYKSMLAAEGNKFFDLRASTQDQVYGGVAAEYVLGDSAIHETQGKVLLHADTLTRCYYHSTCGGMTASRHEVWGGPVIPYLIAQPDTDLNGVPWCHASKYMHWEQSWSVGDLAAILHANLEAAGVSPAPAFRRIVDVTVRDRFADGRVSTLEMKTDQGSFELHGDKIRVALKSAPGSNAILHSARFDIDMDGDRITAHGSGNGHGVGMCQMGALARSAAGQSYVEILSAYYPGTTFAVAK